MIFYSLTINFCIYIFCFYKWSVINKSSSKFRSREKVDLDFLFILFYIYIFSEKAFILLKECLYIKTFNSVGVS